MAPCPLLLALTPSRFFAYGMAPLILSGAGFAGMGPGWAARVTSLELLFLTTTL